MAKTFAADLRASYELGEGLPAHARELFTRARDNLYVRRINRDRLLAELLTAYRAGPRHLWGPVILDLLAPALLELLMMFRPVPPLLDEDEIRQQLVLELLRAAARIPIRDGFDLQDRLLARAYKYVVRWLAREDRRQRDQCSYEVLTELER